MSDIEKALTKVRQLIALAASSHSTNEARTAAFEACKLISAHKLEIAGPSNGESTELPAPSGSTGFGSWGDEAFNEVFNASKATRVDMQVRAATRGGKCSRCGKDYMQGEKVAFFPGRVGGLQMQIMHIACSGQRARQQGSK